MARSLIVAPSASLLSQFAPRYWNVVFDPHHAPMKWAT